MPCSGAHALDGMAWLDTPPAPGVPDRAENALSAAGHGLLWLSVGTTFAGCVGAFFVEWVRTRWWEFRVAVVIWAAASALATLMSFSTAT